MARFAAIRRNGVVLLQCAIVLAVLLGAALYPPARGRLLLIPVLPGSGDHLLTRAIDQGALLVGTGPLPNSFVVAGPRDAIATSLDGVIVLAAPPAGCGRVIQG